jgi:hypothetical protein
MQNLLKQVGRYVLSAFQRSLPVSQWFQPLVAKKMRLRYRASRRSLTANCKINFCELMLQ